MGIALTLENFLKSHQVTYDVIEHNYSEGAYNTAIAAHIHSRQLLKGVVFCDEDMYYTMAILPASHRVKRFTLNQIFDRHLRLAEEDELEALFPDCEPGAIPCLGQAYGLKVIWDDDIEQCDEYWLEAGDHKHLIHLTREQFEKLVASDLHDHIGACKRFDHTHEQQDWQETDQPQRARG